MVTRTRFLRPVPPAPPEVDMQKLVYDLVHERVMRMLGPGGSFAITLRGGEDSDSFFSQTVADTLAWDVSSGLKSEANPSHRLTA